MNKQRHKNADLIIAWAEGAEIEFRTIHNHDWYSTDTPAWNECTEYRIKPKQVEKWQWVARYGYGSLYITTHVSDEGMSKYPLVNFVQKIDSTKIIAEE